MGENLAGLRVDKALACAFIDLSRSRIHGLIDIGAILLNGEHPRPSAKLREGDRLSVAIPEAIPSNLEPEPGELKSGHCGKANSVART